MIEQDWIMKIKDDDPTEMSVIGLLKTGAFVIFVIIGLVVSSYVCPKDNTPSKSEITREQYAQACIDHGGIPSLDKHAHYNGCDFPPS